MKRAELKETTRAKTPEPVRSFIESNRPIAGEKAKASEGIVNNPSKTNANVNQLAENFGRAGKVLTGVAVGISVYNVATSDEPVKQTAKEAGGWVGAFEGGTALAELGALGGPWGAAAGGLVGAVLGGYFGEKFVSSLIDK